MISEAEDFLETEEHSPTTLQHRTVPIFYGQKR